jgi:hypothetical protein
MMSASSSTTAGADALLAGPLHLLLEDLRRLSSLSSKLHA